jgi:hypothetical protein
MRRVLLAGAVFLTVAASPGLAGYIILRVVLDGAGGAPAAGGEAGPGGPSLPGPGLPGPGSSTGPGSGRFGPMGGPGGPGSSGSFGPMPPGGATGATGVAPDHTRSIVVVVPLETDLAETPLDPKKVFNPNWNPRYRKFSVPLHGNVLRTNLFVDSTQIQLYDQLLTVPGSKKTRHTQMRDKYLLWAKDKKDPQLLYDALVLALECGHIRETVPPKDGSAPKDAVSFAAELLAVAAEKKLTLPRDPQAFVTAWAAVSKEVLGPAKLASNGPEWQGRLDAKANRTEGHYTIVSWDTSDVELRRRSRQLNDHFIAFYLLHATRGVSLPVPAKPLVVVLAEQAADVRRLRTVLDVLPGTTDAYYAPDHQVLLLAPERLDDVGRTFVRQNQQALAKGLNRETILRGELPPKLDPAGEEGPRPDDVARVSTLGLIEKLMAEEAEVAAISREGSRQLLFATGELPAHVTLPEWFANGSVNYFARPRGPLFVNVGDDEKPFMSVALTTGYGVPNYLYQRAMRDLDERKELNADRAKLLENVLSDAYFNGLKDAIDPDPAPPKKKVQPKGGQPGPGPMGPGPIRPAGPGSSSSPPGPMNPEGPATGPVGTAVEDPVVAQRKARDRLALKAQASAWSLYYFLARAKQPELVAYVAELNKLPRDLPIDGKTSFAAFVRAFKLSTAPDGPADPALLKKLAAEWFEYMTTVPSASIDIPVVVPEGPPRGPGAVGPGPMGGFPGGDPDR